MPKIGLDRQQLAKFLNGNAEAIRAFERVFDTVEGMPSTIEDAARVAASAAAVGQLALGMLSALAELVERTDTAPAALPEAACDDFAPSVSLGTISSQNADAVDIEGGAVDGTIIGGTVPAAVTATLITAEKGADLGVTIGDVTTNNGSVLRLQGTSMARNWHISNNVIAAGLNFTPSTANGGTTYTTPTFTLQPGAATVTGTHTVTGAFGCNGATAQTAAASGGTLGGVIAALVATGILSS